MNKASKAKREEIDWATVGGIPINQLTGGTEPSAFKSSYRPTAFSSRHVNRNVAAADPKNEVEEVQSAVTLESRNRKSRKDRKAVRQQKVSDNIVAENSPLTDSP